MNDYPPNCPPQEADDVVGSIYIFVKNNPPLSIDFQTPYEKGRFPDGHPCIRRSLSCGKNIQYLQSIQDLFPIKRGWLKAKGKMLVSDGAIKQTTDNILHHSFWVNSGLKVSIHKKFEVI